MNQRRKGYGKGKKGGQIAIITRLVNLEGAAGPTKSERGAKEKRGSKRKPRGNGHTRALHRRSGNGKEKVKRKK